MYAILNREDNNMYNGDVSGVNGGNNAQWNKKLAEQLDLADGKKDGKISASVWNGYLKAIGSTGNQIKNFININNAEKSFNYYKTTKDNGKADWNNWEAKLDDFKKSHGLAVEQETKPDETTGVKPDNTAGTAAKPDETTGAKPDNTAGAAAKPDTSDVREKFNINERLENAKNNGGKVAWSKNGDWAVVTYPDGGKHTYTLDGNNIRVEITDTNGYMATHKYTLDNDGHIVSESDIRKGVNTGKEIEIKTNYYEDGSIEKTAYVDGEKMDKFDDEETKSIGEIQFLAKNSPMKPALNSKFPTEAELLKLGYKKSDMMTTNGDACYVNEKTGESFILGSGQYPLGMTCEYRNGNVRQTQSFDKDGNPVSGRVAVKGQNGAFDIYEYDNSDDGKLGWVGEQHMQAKEEPADYALDALNGHENNITEECKDFGIPENVEFDDGIYDEKTEKMDTSKYNPGTNVFNSKDGNYKITQTVDENGNVTRTYSQKQPDGSYKDMGTIKLIKEDSPGSLRGYDYRFEADNNTTGAHHVISSASWDDLNC